MIDSLTPIKHAFDKMNTLVEKFIKWNVINLVWEGVLLVFIVALWHDKVFEHLCKTLFGRFSNLGCKIFGWDLEFLNIFLNTNN